LDAGVGRFRPILLTSLTTFVGLTPLMLEKSLQAQFLIPMAISLAFGVAFSTFVTLLFVPAGYLMLIDLQRWLRWIFGAEEAVAAGAGTRDSRVPRAAAGRLQASG